MNLAQWGDQDYKYDSISEETETKSNDLKLEIETETNASNCDDLWPKGRVK